MSCATFSASPANKPFPKRRERQIDQLVTMGTKAGLTQEEVAKKLGTNKNNLSRLDATENDRTSA